MTVSTTTNVSVQRGNGSADTFSYNFLVLDADHLTVERRVYATGVVDKTYLASEYTVSGVGAPSGSVQLAAGALAATYEIIITRTVPYTQEMDIVNQGGFQPDVVEEQADLEVMAIQQIAEIAGRAIVVAKGGTGFELPSAEGRASLFPYFDSAGELVLVPATSSDGALEGELAGTGGAAKIGTADGTTLASRLGNGAFVDDLSVTIGAGGTYATLAEFCDWVHGVVVTGTITATITELDTAGSMTLDAQNARYTGPGKVILQGAAFGGGQGAYALTDLPTYSVAVADEAAFETKRDAIKTYLRTQFNASIVLDGANDLNGGSGLIGAFHFKRLLIEGNGRYTIDNGFIGSHANSQSGQGSLIFEDCAVVGGVWGAIGSGARITLTGTRNLFACQISGGPFDIIDGRLFANASTFVDLYFPLVTTPFANMPQTAVTLDHGTFECGVARLTMWGPFKHGFLTRGQSTVIASDVVSTHVTQLVTAKDNSFVDVGTFTVNNADHAATSATPGAEQTNITGNSTSRAVIFAGRGAVVSCDGGTINNSDNIYAYCLADGGTIQTFAEITAVSSRVLFGGGLGEFAAINGGLLIGAFGLTTPVAGGNEWYFANSGGRIILTANDGTLGYNLARNSMKNGSAIFDTANPNYEDGAVWVAGTRMLRAQGANIANPAGGATIDAEARTAIDAIIASLEAHRLNAA